METKNKTYHFSLNSASEMKTLVLVFSLLSSVFAFAQSTAEEKALQLQKANNYVYEGNELIDSKDYVSAEMEYRKAISEQPTTVAGTYNLGNSYYEKGQLEEALYRHTQAAKNATSKSEKHKAYHNIGNILMQNKLCKEAVEAFKNALRNNPSDDETRYNFAIAKQCAEQQQDNQDENDQQEKEEEKEGDDEEKDKGENQEKDEPKDEGDDEKKDGDDQKDDQGKPEDKQDKKDGKEGENKNQQGQPKPKQGQLSPQQIKNLLEAMNNQEQKVQEKINAEKQKGVKVKTEKDW